ncbi:probable carboxylesterase 18 [Brachypodium distachyon]|uniref:Alpha/beta hydrolase fold-3 domain-containing protein n=1 Tax=Brachypodium distachyon TaxID=15368 RepID=A0A0Q3RZL7_BRADI|nr:probable carboxylesterase 18 [Brachypodium distachyon]KQK18058.2 hypothetical protein BRADI_1g38325v3 [Brachypodium distachyon]|eukprot:XP_003560678.2 probable carboxylesterase 18 [Brachypodium distachyon]
MYSILETRFREYVDFSCCFCKPRALICEHWLPWMTENGGERRKKIALPWAVRLQVMALTTACDLAQRRDGTVNRFLFSLVDRRARATSRPDAAHGVSSADVTIDGARAAKGLWARVFSPPSPPAAPLPVVVYFHGGGFTLLSAASAPMDALCRRLARALGAVVVSVDYRLAPEHPYPAAYDDGEDVLGYLAATNAASLPAPVDLSRCFLAGDSAGGNIAHHVAHRWTSDDPNNPNPKHVVQLAGIILLQPYFGGEERTGSEISLEGVAPVVNMRRSDWSWKAFLPLGADRNHEAAHVTGEAEPEPKLGESFPPAMVVVGGFDPLKDWQRRYAVMLERKNRNAAVRLVDFPEAIHGFYMFPKLPEAGEVVEKVRAFIETCTAHH